MKIIRTTYFLLLVAACCSCERNTVFAEHKTLPQKGWNKDTPVAFDVEIKDTISTYDDILFVRNNASYPNQNLWLFVDETQPDGKIKKDTIQCFLVDNQGKWVGSGIGSLYYVEVFYKKDTRYAHPGKYHYEIRHCMRYDILEGLRDIGLKIKKQK